MYALTVEGAALELWMERCLEKVEADEAESGCGCCWC